MTGRIPTSPCSAQRRTEKSKVSTVRLQIYGQWCKDTDKITIGAKCPISGPLVVRSHTLLFKLIGGSQIGAR